MAAPPRSGRAAGFAASLPPALSSRLRALSQEPNFGLLFDGSVGRVTFTHLAERLKGLAPLLPGELAALAHCLDGYVDAQLRAGALRNLVGAQTLFEPLGLTDLPLRRDTLDELATWLERIPAEDWRTLTREHRLRGERNGTVFESRWHQDFIPNWIPDGVERAFRAHAAAYLKAENAWVKANGIEPEQLDRLIRARETLLHLGGRTPAQRRVGLPSSVALLLKGLEKR